MKVLPWHLVFISDGVNQFGNVCSLWHALDCHPLHCLYRHVQELYGAFASGEVWQSHSYLRPLLQQRNMTERGVSWIVCSVWWTLSLNLQQSELSLYFAPHYITVAVRLSISIAVSIASDVIAVVVFIKQLSISASCNLLPFHSTINLLGVICPVIVYSLVTIFFEKPLVTSSRVFTLARSSSYERDNCALSCINFRWPQAKVLSNSRLPSHLNFFL